MAAALLLCRQSAVNSPCMQSKDSHSMAVQPHICVANTTKDTYIYASTLQMDSLHAEHKQQ